LRSAASDNIRIHVDDGLLTLDAHAVPLSVLLRAIGEEAGFEVVIEGDLDVPVDHSFTRVPLEQGLKRLLDRNSFMVFFDGPENMQELRVLETLRDASEQPVQPTVTTIEEPSRADIETWILDRLADPQPQTRIVAVRRLVHLEPDVAANIAARVLKSENDPVVRGQTVATLGKIGGDSVSGLLELALADQQASVRKHAIRAFRTVGAGQAITALESILTGDPDREVRLMALETLMEVAADNSQYYLALAAIDQDETIRKFANQTLNANENPTLPKVNGKENGTRLEDAQVLE
jgi:hypothetical protein